MEYSPGPWEARYEDLAYTIYAADEYDIALVACYPAELEQANALLIAAAPDLLEAAKSLLRYLNEHDYLAYEISSSFWDEVVGIKRAAAKAEGREDHHA